MEMISAPFDAQQVQCLNEYQVGVNPEQPFHPFTCRNNRGDGSHGREGGDLGLLIATPVGWVCPSCDYTQDWAFRLMAERHELEPSSFGEFTQQVREFFATRVTSEGVAKKIAEYEPLAATGRKGADVMVTCLRARKAEIDAGAITNTSGG